MTHALPLSRTRALRAVTASLIALLLVATGVPAVEALGRLVSVIVIDADAGEAAQLTEANHGQVDHVLPIVDGVAARIPESRLDDVARTAHVYPDRAIKMQSASYGDSLVSVYPREVGADRLWDDGVTGEGVTVALVDTGVADVPDLRDRLVAVANFSEEPTYVDTYGHGTFQAGLMVGTGASSNGRYVGIAPGADLLSVKVANREGETSLGQVLAGVQLVDHSAERFGVRVLLLAVDSASPLPPELDPLSHALRRLWSHGVVVVVPAGNDGPDPGSIASPGEDPVLLTAASVDDQGTADVHDDVASEFSARGPTRFGEQKPDVAAPGRSLVSLRAPGSFVDEANPSARVEDAYFKGSGTSMSAAVTAGAAALLLSARPDLTPDEVKALLMGTATPVEGEDLDSIGAGVIDAASAAAYDGELPELSQVPDMGDADAPWSPPGLDFDWVAGDDGVHVWAAKQWAAKQWAAKSWAAKRWDAKSWGAKSWGAKQWGAKQWRAKQWGGKSWGAKSWVARSWAAKSWAAKAWAAKGWAAKSWAAKGWAAKGWTAEHWDAKAWAARSWTDAEWDAARWDAIRWDAARWDALRWDAKSWSAARWDAKSWDAARWDAKSWDAKSWDAKSWDAARWDAARWDAASWSNAGWG